MLDLIGRYSGRRPAPTPFLPSHGTAAQEHCDIPCTFPTRPPGYATRFHAWRLTTLRITSFTDSAEFLRAIERDFGSHEVEHHLLLGAVSAASAATGERAPGSIFATVQDDTGMALAAFMTPPHPLLLVTDRQNVDAAIVEFARWLGHRSSRPRGLVADAPVAERFIAEWQHVSEARATLRIRQRLHVLRRVAPVPRSKGSLRMATPDDLDLVARWTGAFKTEAMSETLDPELRQGVAQRIVKGEVHLWDDGEPRSMAATARPTAHGIALNSVYTPSEFRGRGYATTAVAALSQRMLDQGRQFCVLYTDLGNPTSNAIYARVGYQPVADSVLYGLSA